MRVVDLITRHDRRSDGTERVVALAPQPLVTHAQLLLPRGHIVGAAVAGDVIERVVVGDVLPAAADHDAQLRLVIEVAHAGRSHDVVVRADDGVVQLGEQDGAGGRLVAELARVLTVVASDADDLAGSGDRGRQCGEVVRVHVPGAGDTWHMIGKLAQAALQVAGREEPGSTDACIEMLALRCDRDIVDDIRVVLEQKRRLRLSLMAYSGESHVG